MKEIALDSVLGEGSGAERTTDDGLSLVYVSQNVLVHAIMTELMLAVNSSKLFPFIFSVAHIAWVFGISSLFNFFLSH